MEIGIGRRRRSNERHIIISSNQFQRGWWRWQEVKEKDDPKLSLFSLSVKVAKYHERTVDQWHKSFGALVAGERLPGPLSNKVCLFSHLCACDIYFCRRLVSSLSCMRALLHGWTELERASLGSFARPNLSRIDGGGRFKVEYLVTGNIDLREKGYAYGI